MMRKILDKLFTVAMVLLIIWFVFSWLEVIANNTDPNATYSSINLFTWLFTRGA